MESEWTVECGADDPWVVVPWSRTDDTIHYIDLRAAPERVKEIPEAARNSCIGEALLRWNGPASPIFTAKCDVWNYGADLFDANDLPGFAFAHGSYFDLLARDLAIYSSFAASERALRNWTQDARSMALPAARCEWILRRARILSAKTNDAADDGFATTLYVWGYGPSPASAMNQWNAAVLALVEPVLEAGQKSGTD